MDPRLALLLQDRRAAGVQSMSVGAPLFLTPDAVRTRLEQVNGEFAAVNTDVQTLTPAPGAMPPSNVTATQAAQLSNLRSAWSQFATTWTNFYNASQGTLHLLVTGTGTVNRQIDSYEQQIASYRQSLQNIVGAGAQLSSPPIGNTNPLTPPNAPPAGESTNLLPWWAISGLTLVGVGAVVWLSYSGYKAIRYGQEKKKVLENIRDEYALPAIFDAPKVRPKRAHVEHKQLTSGSDHRDYDFDADYDPRGPHRGDY